VKHIKNIKFFTMRHCQTCLTSRWKFITHILFVPCTVQWITHSISTKICTILYTLYFTINLLLHVSA